MAVRIHAFSFPTLEPALQSLSQATNDGTELRAAFQAERAEMMEEAGVLRARVAQLQALQSAGVRELEAVTARMEGGSQQLAFLVGGTQGWEGVFGVPWVQWPCRIKQGAASTATLAGCGQHSHTCARAPPTPPPTTTTHNPPPPHTHLV